MWYILILHIYIRILSGTKNKQTKNDVLIHPITWMNPENTLNEISQAQKDKCYDYLYKIPKMGKFIETDSRLEVTRGWKMGSYC